MPRWLLFGLAAVADLIAAVVFYRSGRIVLPAILAFACVCFVIAAVGSAMTQKGSKD